MKILSTGSIESISSTERSQRIRLMRGNRSAYPIPYNELFWISSNFNSTTTFGSIKKDLPCCSRAMPLKYSVISSISRSVSPPNAFAIGAIAFPIPCRKGVIREQIRTLTVTVFDRDNNQIQRFCFWFQLQPFISAFTRRV